MTFVCSWAGRTEKNSRHGQKIQKSFRNRPLATSQNAEAIDRQWLGVVEAAGVEPASLTNEPTATTCLVGREFSSVRLRPDPESHSLARRIRSSVVTAPAPLTT